MKMIYITNARIPTEKAHGYQIFKMCEEFAKQGADVELWVPSRINPIKEDPFAFYGIKTKFKIVRIWTPDFIYFGRSLGRLSFYMQSTAFLLGLFFKRPPRDSVIYTRSSEIAYLFGQRGYRVYFEAHGWPGRKNSLLKFFLKKTTGIVCNSVGTEEAFRKNGFSHTLVAPNGVDLEEFSNVTEGTSELRKKYDFPLDKKIVTYVGHFYDWKGVDSLIGAAEILKGRQDISFLLIGGTTEEINKIGKLLKDKTIENVIFMGFQKKKNIPEFMVLSDLLVLPNAPISKVSISYTSPIKMFEYMASRKPIIASDLPSIRQILNDSDALFFRAGDSSALAGRIKWAIDNYSSLSSMAERAYDDVKKYTWEERAKKVLNFIK